MPNTSEWVCRSFCRVSRSKIGVISLHLPEDMESEKGLRIKPLASRRVTSLEAKRLTGALERLLRQPGEPGNGEGGEHRDYCAA